MRNQILILFTLILFLNSCKKNSGTTDVNSQVKLDDPKAVSAAIKVWHGIREPGTTPVQPGNANAPVIDPSQNNESVAAIAGHYAIIQPRILSGETKGYYLSVRNSGGYFKVDFDKPRNNGRILPKRVQHKRGMLLRELDAGDSSIVIVLPSNIQPGTFCVTWWAYDSGFPIRMVAEAVPAQTPTPTGNMSNTVTMVHGIMMPKQAA